MLGGTIRYATENLGRQLISVAFDTGQSMMVLADDVTYDENVVAVAAANDC
jgi:hypothetical protein